MTDTDTGLAYYRQRAAEYDLIYSLPERQTDLEWLSHRLSDLLENRTVLEVACGTGYWTERLARPARRILALDAAPEVLSIARSRSYAPGRVSFVQADVFTLPLSGQGTATLEMLAQPNNVGQIVFSSYRLRFEFEAR